MKTTTLKKGPLKPPPPPPPPSPLPSPTITPLVTPFSKMSLLGLFTTEAGTGASYIHGFVFISCYLYMKGHVFFITCLICLTRRHLRLHFKNYACATLSQSPTRLMWHQNEWSFTWHPCKISHRNGILSPSQQRGRTRTGHWFVSGGIIKTKQGHEREPTGLVNLAHGFLWYSFVPQVVIRSFIHSTMRPWTQ